MENIATKILFLQYGKILQKLQKKNHKIYSTIKINPSVSLIDGLQIIHLTKDDPFSAHFV